MCGFFGFLPNLDIKTYDSSIMEEATNIIQHRGPDDHGFYANEHVFLGFRRLSIIDLDFGHQPLSYLNERYWIIFNGEIYNFLEMKEELIEKNVEFKTNSDTEVVLAAYHHYKEEVVHHLRGMYAFLIWDNLDQTLFGARDHFGIKPLYYAETGKGIIFASEKKSIELVYQNIQNLTLDNEGLQHYTTFQFPPEPYTMHKEIKKVLPGYFFSIKRSEKVLFKKYFKPYFIPQKVDFETLKNEVLETLRNSVRIHMRSDVPVGSFLSGGIDSSVIVALAKEVNPQMKTFTVGFEREGFSEIDLAKETARSIGVENIHKVITPDEFLEELPKIVWHMDEPVADPASIPLYFVAKEAKKHVTVVLSGEGADELFGGYAIYREPFALEKFNRLPEILKKVLLLLGRLIPKGVKGKNFLDRASQTIEKRYNGNAKIFLEKEKQHLLYHYDKNKPFYNFTKPFYQDIKAFDDPTKMQYIDMHTWLSGDILIKADRMTMANSLELRVPFLDKEVFTIASSIPTEYKFANGTTKYILRQAAKEIVPESVSERKKLGFPVPIRHWIKDEWYDWIENFLQEEKENPYINTFYVAKLLKNHKNGKGDFSRKIWTVLNFLLWYNLYEKGMTIEALQARIIGSARHQRSIEG